MSRFSFVDRTGHRVGMLTAQWPVGASPNGRVAWLALCDCGNLAVVLYWGQRKSCDCVRALRHGGRVPRHGYCRRTRKAPEYNTWLTMRQRCQNPNYDKYSYYGGRGIRVCERWQVFENFLADMGPRPEGKTLDRIETNGNYEPGNCRWATRSEQQQNTRRSRKNRL